MGCGAIRFHRKNTEMTSKLHVLSALMLTVGSAAAAGLHHGQFNIGTYCLATYAQTEDHLRDMKEAGIDFVIDLCGNSGRPLLAKYGIQEIVGGYIPHPPGTPTAGSWAQEGTLEKFDKGCAKFRADYDAGKYPTFAALSLGDEPNAVDFPHLGKTVARVHKAMAGLPLYLNLFPAYASTTPTEKYPKAQLGTSSYKEYIAAYCRNVPIDHICWDFYMYSPPDHSLLPKFYENFTVVADACRNTGRTLRFIGQVNSSRENFLVSENMLRFQGFATMAFGGESIAWACWTAGWWKNFVIDAKGRKTQQYEKVKKVNAELKRLSPEYMRFRNVATYFVGFPQNCEDLKLSEDEKPVEALDDGFMRNLRALDGDRLVVGAMVARKEGCADRAYFVLAADDPFDEAHKTRSVRFALAEGFSAKVHGWSGNIALGTGDDGNKVFNLESCAGVLIVVSPASVR